MKLGAGSNNNSFYGAILSILIILIGVLVGGILAVKSSTEKTDEKEYAAMISMQNKMKFKLHSFMMKIENEYEEGRHKEALQFCIDEIEKIIGSGDYDEFIMTINAVAEFWTGKNRCDYLMRFYDGVDVDILSAERKLNFYETAGATSEIECGDIERGKMYSIKIQELYDKGEVEDAEN